MIRTGMRGIIELIRKHPKIRRILRCESPYFHHCYTSTTQCTTSWQAGKAHSPVSTLNTLHSAQQAGKAHSPVSTLKHASSFLHIFIQIHTFLSKTSTVPMHFLLFSVHIWYSQMLCHLCTSVGTHRYNTILTVLMISFAHQQETATAE